MTRCLIEVRHFALGALVVLGACRPARPASEATPVVVIQPGYVERIALMDQYRLGDDLRKRMMVRPRVWVEEVSDSDEETADPEPEATAPDR